MNDGNRTVGASKSQMTWGFYSKALNAKKWSEENDLENYYSFIHVHDTQEYLFICVLYILLLSCIYFIIYVY